MTGITPPGPAAGRPADALPVHLARSIEALRQHWTGRCVVLLCPSFTSETRAVIAELAACGARVVGIVSATPLPDGAPSIPSTFSCAQWGLGVAPEDFDAWLVDPPAVLEAWLAQADPGRSWLVVGLTFHRTGELFGRPVWGWRRPQWAAWEDKTRIESLWPAVEVPSPPHVVVSVDDPEVADHVRALDRGLGVVIAADASRYCFRGAEGIRWVRGPAELDPVLRWARAQADRIRIAEFVAGRPCCILAMVFADGVAVFDPVELVTLVDRTTGQLEFCGTSTRWRPDPGHAEQLRGYGRRIGIWLAQNTGFRGMFSVDGLSGDHGFMATELNPRQSSGLAILKGWPGFPLNLFQRGLQEALPGVFQLPSREVEAAFRDVGRRYPGHTVRLRCQEASPRPGTRTAQVLARGREQRVDYRFEGRTVRLLTVEPGPADGVVAPTAAALARHLGRPGLVAPDDLVPTARRGPVPSHPQPLPAMAQTKENNQ